MLVHGPERSESWPSHGHAATRSRPACRARAALNAAAHGISVSPEGRPFSAFAALAEAFRFLIQYDGQLSPSLTRTVGFCYHFVDLLLALAAKYGFSLDPRGRSGKETYC